MEEEWQRLFASNDADDSGLIEWLEDGEAILALEKDIDETVRYDEQELLEMLAWEERMLAESIEHMETDAISIDEDVLEAFLEDVSRDQSDQLGSLDDIKLDPQLETMELGTQ